MKQFLLILGVMGLSGMMAMAQTDKDPATYAPTAAGEQLTNLYLNSSTLHTPDGGTAQLIYPGGVAGDARGMAVTNGKMYICNRQADNTTALIEIDGTTGAYLRTIELPIEMWQEDGVTLSFVCNDVQVDEAGNIFVANMTTDMRGTGAAHIFRINYVDVSKTPVEYKTILNATLSSTLPLPMRVDTYDLYGNILNGDGIILLPISGNDAGAGNTVVKYTVTGGVADATNPQTIVLTELNPSTATGSGAAPRINIIDEELFYLDGFNTYPMLYDMNGNAVDGFQNNKPLTPRSTGQNGVTEFELNGSYYLIVASTNTNNTPPQAFDIFKYKDEGRAFSDMTLLYTFPEAGMGKASNAVRTALPRVEIVDGEDGRKKARINVYAYRNGYGIYEFTNSLPTSIKGTVDDGFQYTVNGRDISVSQLVRSITLYNMAGQKVNEVYNAQTIKAPAGGVYIATITDKAGSKKATKVVLR